MIQTDVEGPNISFQMIIYCEHFSCFSLLNFFLMNIEITENDVLRPGLSESHVERIIVRYAVETDKFDCGLEDYFDPDNVNFFRFLIGKSSCRNIVKEVIRYCSMPTE